MADNVFTSIYNGKVTVRFNPVKHWYCLSGEGKYLTEKFKYVPSVTTICNLLDKSSWLVPWRDRIIKAGVSSLFVNPEENTPTEEEILDCFSLPEQDRDDAGNVGTDIHRVVENEVNKLVNPGMAVDFPTIDPENETICRKVQKEFHSWNSDSFDWEFAERPLYSTKYHYVGTTDGVFWDGKDLINFDVKTSKPIKTVRESYRLQTAGYCQAILDEFGHSPTKRLILRVDRGTGEFQEVWDQTDQWPASWKEDLNGFLGLRQAYKWLRGK